MGMEGTLGPQARAKGPIVYALYGQPACLKVQAKLAAQLGAGPTLPRRLEATRTLLQ